MADQPLIDISPENWRIVRDILQRHVPDREVWAFGSRAKWTAKEYSDLDIAVIGDEPLSIGVMAELNESFQESALPFKVDVVDWAAITSSFKDVVAKNKIVLVSPELPNPVWTEARLEDLKAASKSAFAMGPFGSRIKAENFVPSGVPVIKGGNLNGDFINEHSYDFLSEDKADELSSSEAKHLDLVITHRGTIGQVGIIPETSKYPRYIVSQSQLKLSFDKAKVNPYFVYYYLRSPEGQHRLLMNASQVGVPAIAQALTSIRNIRIPYPRKDEQDEIVSILRSFDQRVALLRETNATLEAIAQALFKSWFVDFDPVRAKAEGREPEAMPPEIAGLFPSGFEESEIGEVPKGWAVEPFGKLLGHAIGGDWGKDDADDEHTTAVAIVRGTDIPDIKVGNLDGVPRRFVSPKKLKSRRLQDGDLIIEVSGGSKTQATGRSIYCTDGLLDDFGTPVVPASFCRLFRPADKLLGILLAIHLSSIYAAGKMWNYQVQSTGLANFQTTHFLESELVVVPSEPIREAFFDCVRPLIERQQRTDIRSLGLLRDSLLPRLLDGSLRV